MWIYVYKYIFAETNTEKKNLKLKTFQQEQKLIFFFRFICVYAKEKYTPCSVPIYNILQFIYIVLHTSRCNISTELTRMLYGKKFSALGVVFLYIWIVNLYINSFAFIYVCIYVYKYK